MGDIPQDGRSKKRKRLILVMGMLIAIGFAAGLALWFGVFPGFPRKEGLHLFGEQAEDYLRVLRAVEDMPPPSKEEIEYIRREGVILVGPR